MVYKGYGILWGNASTLATLTGLGTLTLLQSEDVNALGSEKEVIRDGNGNTATLVFYDHKSKATLDFVVNGGTNASTLTVTSWPSAGDTLAITDASFTPIAGTWLVDEGGSNLSRANNKALMAKISLEKFTNNSIP